MIELDERQHALACMEVWGTNRSVNRTVDLPELTAWVYSKPADGENGGDVHYLSVCGQAVLSRVVLADVSGHGAQVSGSAQLSEFRQDNFTDDETIIAIQRGNPL